MTYFTGALPRPSRASLSLGQAGATKVSTTNLPLGPLRTTTLPTLTAAGAAFRDDAAVARPPCPPGPGAKQRCAGSQSGIVGNAPHAIDLCNGGGLECTRSEEVAELRGGGIDEATPSRMPRIYKGWTSGV